jgi:hypothetical protein
MLKYRLLRRNRHSRDVGMGMDLQTTKEEVGAKEEDKEEAGAKEEDKGEDKDEGRNKGEAMAQ